MFFFFKCLGVLNCPPMMMSGLALGSMSQSMKLTYFGDPHIFPLA